MSTIEEKLQKHNNSYSGEIDTLEVMIPDVNGQIRGKILKISPKDDLDKKTLLMPISAIFSDFGGDCVTETGLVWETGDTDYPCRFNWNTLRHIPWQSNAAQVIAQILDNDGKPFSYDPRTILQRLIDLLAKRGLRASTAVELEFSLVPQNTLNTPREFSMLPTLPASGQIDDRSQLYDTRRVQQYQPLFDEIMHSCSQQAIPADTIISEAAPNQFEINLHHQDDVLLATDQAMMLRRLIKAVALKHGFIASFMAKPFAHYPGNGMHVHISLCDETGKNIFTPDSAKQEYSDLLLHAVAGLQRTMAGTVLPLFPNINSFKRIAKFAYAPSSSHWGINNRNVCLRIPGGELKARRIEHRLAGADANPYLVMSSILAGIEEGLKNPQAPTPITHGKIDNNPANSLPSDPVSARNAFVDSPFIREYFGEDFQRYFSVCHDAEIQRYQKLISPIELDWYFEQI